MSIISSITDNVTLTSSNSAINFNSASGNINIKTAYAVNQDASNNINIGNISSQNGIRNINIGNLTALGLTGRGNINIGNSSSNNGITTNYNVVLGNTNLGASLGGDSNIFVGFGVATSSATINSSNNVFIGTNAGNPTTGSYTISDEGNIFLGKNSGFESNIAGYNTLIGYNTKIPGGAAGVFKATAIGANTIVATSNTIQLGSEGETVGISGSLKSGANTISTTQLKYLSDVSGGIIDISTNQIISAVKTFTGGIIASANQSINFGSNAPTMSGTNISATSIPNSALQTSVCLNNTTSTISAVKIFTGGIDASAAQTINFGPNAPAMSGANISLGTIGQTQINKGYVDLSNNQTIDGIKTFSTAPVIKSQYFFDCSSIKISGATTLSSPYYQYYQIDASTVAITITLPTPAAALSGVSLVFRRTNANTGAVNTNSPGFYPLTSTSLSTTLLTASAATAAGMCIKLVCLGSGGTTYNWYQV